MANKSEYISNDSEEQKIVSRERMRKYQSSKHT